MARSKATEAERKKAFDDVKKEHDKSASNGTKSEVIVWDTKACGSMLGHEFSWCPCGRVMDGLCPTELCKRCNGKTPAKDKPEAAVKGDNTEYVVWPSDCGPVSKMDVGFCPCGRVMKRDCPTDDCEACLTMTRTSISI